MSFRLPWFRRKKTEQEAPAEAAAPAQPAPAVEAPTDVSGESPERPKRRRGSRGGRGRKKTTDATAVPEAARKPEQAAKAEKPEKPERRPAERRDRSSGRRRAQPKRAALPQAKRELLISLDVGEQRVAVLEDDRVAEVYLERPERRSIAGNIYLGVVDNVLPGMEAAFVEIGLDKNGFLYVDEIVVPELEGKPRQGKRIQDLIQRGQTILVQAVKDPMKTKGARLTTEISLPGRFVVYVPHGEGLGVSRRLPDDERQRLKDIFKALDVPSGGVIVRTAAEGASAEDIERDLVFLQRLWKTIQARADEAKAPALVYQEAELPLRVVRDLFTGDFERALVDNERAYKRIVGYLKKTSPHMVDRVVRYKEKPPLFESSGVDAEIRSTLSRRVDLPSGGYLIFDYAEAFTVIDVNTGRFVGGRGKSSSGRLEDTITKNNLEAVKEVVRQLRLRDIGGIIVIDFIDMANPKNRQTVEEALRTELERDRTKTYVVEISPLGLVEMTRQNVTEGPREILTRKCPACGGDGVVLSEASAAVDAERRLRALAAGAPRTQAFRVELHPRVASLVVGPGAARLAEIEAQTRRRFFFQPTTDGHGVDHFAVVAQGKVDALRPAAPVSEGQELQLKLGEVGLHDPSAGVGKVDGFDVCVGGAASLVGRKVKVRIERVLDGTAYATWVDAPRPDEPITAEHEAEKPTRQPRARKGATVAADGAIVTEIAPDEDEHAEAAPHVEAGEEGEAGAEAKKRTRRGTRGGRGRKRKAAEAPAADSTAPAAADTSGPAAAEAPEPPADDGAGDGNGRPDEETVRQPRIHVPTPVAADMDTGRVGDGDPEQRDVAADGAPAAAEGPDEDQPADGEPPKKRTRRGTRGGRNRKRKTAEVAAGAGGDDAAAAASAPDDSTERRDWDYVPMSEWGDELE